MRRWFPEVTIHDGKQATGWGSVDCPDAQHLILTVATRGLGAGDTIGFKVAGSNSDTEPTFSSASAYNNRWDYLAVRDLQTKDLIVGNTEITALGSGGGTITENVARRFAIEEDNVRWVGVNVTTLSDTTNTFFYAYLSMANDSE